MPRDQGSSSYSSNLHSRLVAASQPFPGAQSLQLGLNLPARKAAGSSWSQVYLQNLLKPQAPAYLESRARGAQIEHSNGSRLRQPPSAVQFAIHGRRSNSRSESRNGNEVAAVTVAEEPAGDAHSSTECRINAASDWFRRIHQHPRSHKAERQSPKATLSQRPESGSQVLHGDSNPSSRRALVLMQQRSRRLVAGHTSAPPLLADAHLSSADAASHPPDAMCSSLQQPVQQSLCSSQLPANAAMTEEASMQLQSSCSSICQDQSEDGTDSQHSASTTCDVQDHLALDSADMLTTASSSALDCDDAMSVGTSQTATDSFADTDSLQGLSYDRGLAGLAEAISALAQGEGHPQGPLLGPSLMGTPPTIAFVGVQSGECNPRSELTSLE